MTTIKYRPDALRDLDTIWSYIAENDPDAADRFVEALRRSVVRLVDHPKSAPARPALGKGLRAVSARNHQLIYRIEGSTIEILRVVDGRRDIRTVFRQGIE